MKSSNCVAVRHALRAPAHRASARRPRGPCAQTIHNALPQGVCFGHQLIAQALGGRVGRAPGWGIGAVTMSFGPDAAAQLAAPSMGN